MARRPTKPIHEGISVDIHYTDTQMRILEGQVNAYGAQLLRIIEDLSLLVATREDALVEIEAFFDGAGGDLLADGVDLSRCNTYLHFVRAVFRTPNGPAIGIVVVPRNDKSSEFANELLALTKRLEPDNG